MVGSGSDPIVKHLIVARRTELAPTRNLPSGRLQLGCVPMSWFTNPAYKADYLSDQASLFGNDCTRRSHGHWQYCFIQRTKLVELSDMQSLPVALSLLFAVTYAFPFDPLYKPFLAPYKAAARHHQYYVLVEKPQEYQPNSVIEIKRNSKRSLNYGYEPFGISANAVKRKILARVGKRQMPQARVGK
ncbi:hypothetical protein M3Y97_00807800 [Aphelenchoides bicaudatus]|nr:hypothetical protein M3Y97_00807800 [Aphelenchoides bicaudatus]